MKRRSGAGGEVSKTDGITRFAARCHVMARAIAIGERTGRLRVRPCVATQIATRQHGKGQQMTMCQ